MAKARWVWTMPLGRLVVPDEKNSAAVSEGLAVAARASMAASEIAPPPSDDVTRAA